MLRRNLIREISLSEPMRILKFLQPDKEMPYYKFMSVLSGGLQKVKQFRLTLKLQSYYDELRINQKFQ